MKSKIQIFWIQNWFEKNELKNENEIDYAVAGTVIAEVKTSNVMREAALGAGLRRIEIFPKLNF